MHPMGAPRTPQVQAGGVTPRGLHLGAAGPQAILVPLRRVRGWRWGLFLWGTGLLFPQQQEDNGEVRPSERQRGLPKDAQNPLGMQKGR